MNKKKIASLVLLFALSINVIPPVLAQYMPAPGVANPTFTTVTSTNDTTVNLTFTGKFISGRTSVNDTNYSQLASDYMIAFTALTAPRTVTLTTSGITNNQHFIVKDESGAAGTQNITISGVNIDGSPTKTISSNYGVLRFYYNSTAGAYFSE